MGGQRRMANRDATLATQSGAGLPRLTSGLAGHVSPAILAHLVTLADQLATLTDLEAVLDAVADCVMNAFAPTACAVDLIGEDGELAVSSTKGLDQACADFWQATCPTARAVPTSPTIVRPEWRAELGDAAPLTALRLPLALPDRPIVGALTLFTTTADIPEWPEAPLRSIVFQATAAITSSRVRLRDVQAVYTIAQSITGRIDLAQLAESVLQSVVSLFDAAGAAIVLAEGQGMADAGPHVVARIGPGIRQPVAPILLEMSAQHGAPLVLSDLAPTAALARHGLALVAPLLLDRKLLGVLLLTFPTARAFRQSDLWLLAALASQATLALRNAQLYLWSEELAIAEERSRIAREIHDGLAQSLAHKIVKVELCQRLIGRDETRLRQELDEIKASVYADMQDVRHSILALRPLDLEHRGLTDAIQGYVRQFSHDTGITVETQLAPLDAVAAKAQTALFRLVQEALNNIRKHAQADRAGVTIRIDATGEICLIVNDTGCGFDVAAALRRQPGQTGIGLKGMIERTVAAGGTIDIDSVPGRGTRVEIHLPAR